MKIYLKILLFSLVIMTCCIKIRTSVQDPLVTNRDTLVNPSDDFFNYANGCWFKKHPIPSSEIARLHQLI